MMDTAVTDSERRARLLRLEERVLNPRDILNTDCLLVMTSSVTLFLSLTPVVCVFTTT